MKITIPVFKLKREAKILSRKNKIPLHVALDKVAAENGFKKWSHLSFAEANQTPAEKILRNLKACDLLLLAARPGHGKTLLALQLILKAIELGKQGAFFTLDYTELDICMQIKNLGFDPEKYAKSLCVITSDDICAEYISRHLAHNPDQTFIVIDYLQLLDQKRQNSALEAQIYQLEQLAKQNGCIIVVLSQIHRSYELSTKHIPQLEDVKLPNPANLGRFNKTCFLHDGHIEFSDVA